MKKLKLISLLVLTLVSLASFAQISTRSDDPSTFHFGTRPQVGTIAYTYYLDYTSGNFNLSNDPIINFLYYYSNDLVIRGGLKLKNDRLTANGTISDTTLNPIGLMQDASKVQYQNASHEHSLYIGIEKHFLGSNFLDPYVAVEIPLGVSGNTNVMDVDDRNGNYNHSSATSNSFMYGLNGYLGIQAFIADLPIAVGFEWGFMSRGYLFDRTHNIVDTKAGAVTTSQNFYTSNLDATDPAYTAEVANTNFSKLNSRSFSIDNGWRFKACYFFGK